MSTSPIERWERAARQERTPDDAERLQRAALERAGMAQPAPVSAGSVVAAVLVVGGPFGAILWAISETLGWPLTLLGGVALVGSVLLLARSNSGGPRQQMKAARSLRQNRVTYVDLPPDES
jgi:hypothetical protein